MNQKSLDPLIAIADYGRAFTSPSGQTFVALNAPTASGAFVLAIRSRDYRNWFLSQFLTEHEALPSARAYGAVLRYIESRASRDFCDQRLLVWRRVGCRGGGVIPGRILLHLANPDGQIVEIAPEGWSVADGSRDFIQTASPTLGLAPPAPAGALDSPLEILRSCLNLPSRADWLRCLAWLLAAMRPAGPYPVLVLHGPPGAGKSFAARVLRALIDPCSSPFTPIPSSPRQLLKLAARNWILAFDHISAFSPNVADAICRLSSGAGDSITETGEPEPLQTNYARPILLTVTDRWVSPSDLASRSITAALPAIPPQRRSTELHLRAVFNEAMPAILGALCTALSAALRRLHSGECRTVLESAPRCADALAWALAAAPELACTQQEMRDAFAGLPMVSQIVPPIVEAIRAFLAPQGQWTGAAADLIRLLPRSTSYTAPRTLSEHLRENILPLSDAGIDMQFHRANSLRSITLTMRDAQLEKSSGDASQKSEASLQPYETN